MRGQGLLLTLRHCAKETAMSYTPAAFREADTAKLHVMMEGAGLATLVTQSDNGPLVSHLPLLLDPAAGATGVLTGHLARANPQWKASDLSQPAVAVFLGPDAYISPNYYPSKHDDPRTVPTWNYVAVHARGRLETFDDPEQLLALVTRLTERHEQRSAKSAVKPWAVSDAPADYLGKMVRAIVGVRLTIESIDGKKKLSQNRSEADQQGVVAGLSGSTDPNERGVAALMRAGR
jgi:transcriptional regulator